MKRQCQWIGRTGAPNALTTPSADTFGIEGFQCIMNELGSMGYCNCHLVMLGIRWPGCEQYIKWAIRAIASGRVLPVATADGIAYFQGAGWANRFCTNGVHNAD